MHEPVQTDFLYWVFSEKDKLVFVLSFLALWGMTSNLICTLHCMTAKILHIRHEVRYPHGNHHKMKFTVLAQCSSDFYTTNATDGWIGLENKFVE